MATKLLAGPILRRTTTHRICVWLATAQPILLRLTITDLRGNLLGQSILKNLDTQCVQLGRNLYIYLLQARPKIDNEFPRDTLLYYSLEEIDTDKKVQSLDLSDFAYGSFLHPTFFIPTQLKQILHGSCRKPHGGFDQKNQKTIPDALSYGDDLLGKTHSNLEQRPALLLLTGDQIYADEVAISLLAMLRQQASTLIGKQETLPLADDPLIPRLDPSTILLHERKQVLKKKHPIASDSTDKRTSGFSSDESENHLFTFGEFAAMYIYAFGNQPAWEPVWDWSQLTDLGVSNSKEAIKAHGNQKAPLNSYHKTS